MNCAYENYLYIYHTKLMEQNILLIKKNNFQIYFLFYFILKNFFINSTKYVFFLEQKLFYKI